MKSYLLLFFVLNALCLSAQPWLYDHGKSNAHLKSAEKELSLVDNKKAFDQYWQSKSYEKGKGYKQFLRWYHFMEPRIGEDNQLNSQALLEALLAKQEATEVGNATWKPFGPTQTTHTLVGNRLRGNGRLNCIAFHPTNPEILYVGAPSGGIWKSTDGGQSWSTTSDFLSAIGVSDIVVSHENPNHIYVATGDRDGSDAYAIGILKSEDGGETWNTTGLTINYSNKRTINRILMHPNNANIMWAASNAGVYKTTNGWASHKKVITSGIFRDMEINPANPNILLAAKHSRSGGSSGIWRSTNGGESFVESNTGIVSPGNIGRIEIAVTPDNPQLVYAVCSKASNSGFYGFYSSTNSGRTWVEVYGEGSENLNLLGWSSSGTDEGGQGWYDLAIAVNPSNSNEVFVGGVNIWKSSTGGSSWEISSHWTHSGQAAHVHADQHMLAFNPINNILYSANDGGLYKNVPHNQDWVSISNGLEITQFYKFGLSNNSTPSIVGGSQDNGTFLKSDAWSTILGGDGMECFFDYTNSDVIYGSLYYGDIRRSDNGGYSFKSVKPANAENGKWVTPYIIHPNNPNKILAGYDKIYYSTNKGDSWVQLNADFELHYPKDVLFTDLAYAPSNPDVIYAAMSRNIFISQNHGNSWTNITAGLPNSRISSITVEKDNPFSLWVTFSNFSNNKKVYHSTDGGQNWTNISSGIPSIPVNDIVCRPDTDKEIYIGTDIGVYYRSSTSSQWEIFGDSLPSVIVSELEFSIDNQKLWAATYGRGVWNCELHEASSGVDFTCLNTTVCVNSELNLVYNGTLEYDSLEWTINGISYKTMTDTLTFIPTTEGFYNVELKHYKNGVEKNKIKPNYIEATLDIDFEVYPTSIEIVGCPDAPVTLQATGNYDYNWSSSAGTSATNTSVFEVQVVKDQEVVVVASQGGCSASRTATVSFEADKVADAKFVGSGVYGPYFNDCATVQDNEPVPPGISCTSQNGWCPGENTLENSLWFYTIAPRSGGLTIEARGMNVQLAVYRASSASDILNGKYDLLGANDNYPTYTDGSAVVQLGNNLMPKDKLWIQVDGGANGNTGSFELVLQDSYQITSLNGATIEALNMDVYPVPASEQIGYKVYVPDPGMLTITLYDIRGTLIYQSQQEITQPVYEGYFNNNNNLSGVYFLVATTNSSRVLKKVVFE